MPSPKTRTFDVLLLATAGKLSMLVHAENHQAAREQAWQDATNAGHLGVHVVWCIEYPPSIKHRSSRAITDD